jgi:hypothetical protein
MSLRGLTLILQAAFCVSMMAGSANALTVDIDTATSAPAPGAAISITTTPIPPALLLFGSALAGLGFLGRRSRRTSNPSA